MSGYGEFDYAKRAMELGIRHYLLKPLIAEEAEALLRGIALELEAESVLRQIREVMRMKRRRPNGLILRIFGMLTGYWMRWRAWTKNG
ncbi:hypothetical protein LJK87_05740 [Paenibacillus sp. P25]|nr:hypothetical protein LJK87_05740 [Paenibacillus sp. P25]